MAPIFKVLEFLHIIRVAKDYIKRFPCRGASLLAFLGRKLISWWRFCFGRFGSLKSIESSPLGIQASSYSVSGGSTIVREYVTAASSVPTSASRPSLHESADEQPASVTQAVGTHLPVPASISVDHSHAHNAPHPLDGRSLVNHSYANLSAISIQSRASDRYSIITNSRESLRAPLGQPSLPGVAHPQVGHGTDSSWSRERETRPPIPTTLPHTPTYPPLFENVTTNLPSSIHGDGKFDPVVQLSASPAYTPELQCPPTTSEIRRGQPSTSMVVSNQNPLAESLPISSLTNRRNATDGPFAIDTATIHPSSELPAVNLHAELLPGPPTSSSPATVDYFIPDNRIVRLINSDQILRYSRNATIPRVETPYKVEPLTTKFPYFPDPNGSDQDPLRQDCTPWIPATHPDGGLYFYDEERRLFTDTDMHNQTMKEEIEDFYRCLQRLIHSKQLSIPSKNYDLVMDIMVADDGRILWSYYYACHESRCLFWLETYDASFMKSRLFGVKSPAHIKHRLEALYWHHWSLFPAVFDDRRLPLDAYDELMGMLMHGCVDVTISARYSTLPFDNDKMSGWIRLVQVAKEANSGLAYHTAGITRILSYFAHWRFLYFHGQRHARLNWDQTVYDKPKRERSLLITFLSPLFFLAPEDHLREMEKLWTDDNIIEMVWKSLMTKLLAEWHDVILWSTVMLAVNVSFLAIPGVVLSNLTGADITSAKDVDIFTSASQIASSLSTEVSIGSIVIGLLLVRHNRSKQTEDPAGAADYLYKKSDRVFGLEPMAIIFSLPWALLMWSIVIFFVALLLFCFSISNASTRIFVATMSVLMFTLIGWCIRAAWEFTEDEYVWQNSLAVLRRTRAVLLERVNELNPFHFCRPHGHITSTDRPREVRV